MMSELENFIKVEMIKDLTPQQFVDAMDKLEQEIADLKQENEALNEVDDIAGSYRDLCKKMLKEFDEEGCYEMVQEFEEEFNEIGEENEPD